MSSSTLTLPPQAYLAQTDVQERLAQRATNEERRDRARVQENRFYLERMEKESQTRRRRARRRRVLLARLRRKRDRYDAKIAKLWAQRVRSEGDQRCAARGWLLMPWMARSKRTS